MEIFTFFFNFEKRKRFKKSNFFSVYSMNIVVYWKFVFSNVYFGIQINHEKIAIHMHICTTFNQMASLSMSTVQTLYMYAHTHMYDS